MFACGEHLAAPEALLEGVHEALRPRALVGCGAGGVLAAGAEVESGTAVAVWAASLADGAVRSFHAARLAAQKGDCRRTRSMLAACPISRGDGVS